MSSSTLNLQSFNPNTALHTIFHLIIQDLALILSWEFSIISLQTTPPCNYIEIPNIMKSSLQTISCASNTRFTRDTVPLKKNTHIYYSYHFLESLPFNKGVFMIFHTFNTLMYQISNVNIKLQDICTLSTNNSPFTYNYHSLIHTIQTLDVQLNHL